MLLKRIKASNFMKYHQLEIRDIHDIAFIGIFGDNESGKSSIGDAVSFALFGLTARFRNDTIPQLINWDANECEVQLTFIVNGKEYTVVRYIDRKGVNQAAIYNGESTTPTVKGDASVTQEIERLTNFTFEDFRYTFYLVQKEIDLIVKHKRGNTRDVLHTMLGFDKFTKACDILKQEQGNLRSRKEKCESELLVIQSLIKEIKSDSSTEKNLSRQLDDARKQKKNDEMELKNIEVQVNKTQEIVELYRKLIKGFELVEKSFYHRFHKDQLAQLIRSLSEIYALLREEKKRVQSLKNQYQEEWDTFQDHAKEVEKFTKDIQELQLFVQSYHKSIQKRLVFPDQDSKTPHNENLQIALQNQDRLLRKTSRYALFFYLISSFFILAAVYCVGSIVFIHNGLEIWPLLNQNFSASLRHIFWTVSIASIFLAICSMAGVSSCRKKHLKEKQKKDEIVLQIERFQKELDICIGFQIKDFRSMRASIAQLNDLKTRQRLEELEAQFKDIFQQHETLSDLEKRLQSQQEKYSAKQKSIEKREGDIENLSKLIESLGKGVDFHLPKQEKMENLLDDLESLQKNIYHLLETIQKQHVSLREFETEQIWEMEQAWLEYEQTRTKFREVIAIPSLGGGTGMLNRLQLSLKYHDYDRLVQSFSTEKTSFFSSLPPLENFETVLNQSQKKLTELQIKVNELSSSIIELELRSEKCQEEMTKKKDLMAKVNGMHRQIQELDHNMSVHETAVKMMEETLNSADTKFGPGIGRIISKLLPKFTKGRYSHVRVENDMTIKAYSNEKNDFVDLLELSGGTVDQLFMALRLAFSQAIMSVRLGNDSKQFLFFDEPVISFDEERSCSFLDMLSDYNKNFVQIFVISPRPYQDSFFDLVIHTSLNSHALSVSGIKEKRLLTTRLKKMEIATEKSEEKDKVSEKTNLSGKDAPPVEEKNMNKAGEQTEEENNKRKQDEEPHP